MMKLLNIYWPKEVSKCSRFSYNIPRCLRNYIGQHRQWWTGKVMLGMLDSTKSKHIIVISPGPADSRESDHAMSGPNEDWFGWFISPCLLMWFHIAAPTFKTVIIWHRDFTSWEAHLKWDGLQLVQYGHKLRTWTDWSPGLEALFIFTDHSIVSRVDNIK